MRLTTYSDYSLRLLMYLAVRPNERVRIDEVATAYAISGNHLTKVAHQLGKFGYIETVRGRGGGLMLAKPPVSICVGDVVRHTEPDFALVPCFEKGAMRCRIEPACVLTGVMAEARAALLAVLDRYTLADLVAPRNALAQLLAVPEKVY